MSSMSSSTSSELSELLLISSGGARIESSTSPRVTPAVVSGNGKMIESGARDESQVHSQDSPITALRSELAEALQQRTALMFQNKELMQIVEDQDARLSAFETELENHLKRSEDKEILLKKATEAAQTADSANIHLSAQLTQQANLMKEARLEAEERALQNQELKSALGTIEARLGSEIAQISEALRMRKEAHYTALERASTAEETRRQAIDDAHRLQVALQGAHARLVEMEARHQDDEKRVRDVNESMKMHAQESAGLREAIKVLQARHASADGERVRLANELNACLQQLRKATDTLLAVLDRVKLAETAKSRAMESLRSREAEVTDLLSQIELMKRTQATLEQQSAAASEDAELFRAHVATLAAKIRDEAQRAAKDDVGKREAQEQNRVLAARAALLTGHLQASEESCNAERARSKRLETELTAAMNLCGDLRSKLDQNDRLEAEHRALEKSHEELYDKANELQKDLEYAVQKLKEQDEKLKMASSNTTEKINNNKNNNSTLIDGYGQGENDFDNDDFDSIVTAQLGLSSSSSSSSSLGEISTINNNSNTSSNHNQRNSSSSSSLFVPELKVGVGLLLVKGETKEARRLLTRLNLNEQIKKAQMLKPNLVRNGFVKIVCSLLNLLGSEIEKRTESDEKLHMLLSKAENAIVLNQQYAERIANNDETKRRLIVKLARTMMERALSHATLVNSRSHLTIIHSDDSQKRSPSSHPLLSSSSSSSLTSLSLDDASIGDEGVAVLLSSLKNAIQGELSKISSSSSSSTMLQNTFKHDHDTTHHDQSMDRSLMISIQDLSLRNNMITDEGALAIASFLSKGFTGFFEENSSSLTTTSSNSSNSSSTSLHNASPLKMQSAEEVKEGDVKSSTSLVSNSEKTDSTQMMHDETHSKSSSPTVMFVRIHSINLSGNYISRVGVKALAEAAEASSLVQHVFVHASGRIEALGTRSVAAIHNYGNNHNNIGASGAVSSSDAGSSPQASALITVESVIDCSDQMSSLQDTLHPFIQQHASSSPVSSALGVHSLSNVNSSIMSDGAASLKAGHASLKHSKQGTKARPSTSHQISSSTSSSSTLTKTGSLKKEKGASVSRVMTSPSSTFTAQQAGLSFNTTKSPTSGSVGIDPSLSYTNSVREGGGGGGGTGSAALTQLIDDEERERTALLSSSSSKRVLPQKAHVSASHSSVRESDVPSSRVLAEQTREALWMGRAGGLDVVPLTLQESVGPSVLLQRGGGAARGGGHHQNTLSSSVSNTSTRLNHHHPSISSSKESSSSEDDGDGWTMTEGLSATPDIDANRAALDIAGRLLFSVSSNAHSSSGGAVNVKAMVNKSSSGGGVKPRASSAKGSASASSSRAVKVKEEDENESVSNDGNVIKNEESTSTNGIQSGRSTLEAGNSVSSFETKTSETEQLDSSRSFIKSASGSGIAAARNRNS